MPRHPRFCPAGYPVHVIQRGNNRQVVFTSDSDIAAYAHWLKEGASKYEVSIHGWVFMTNHVHLLLTPAHDDSVSKLFQYLGRLYVRFFNFAYARSGTLRKSSGRSTIAGWLGRRLSKTSSQRSGIAPIPVWCWGRRNIGNKSPNWCDDTSDLF